MDGMYQDKQAMQAAEIHKQPNEEVMQPIVKQPEAMQQVVSRRNLSAEEEKEIYGSFAPLSYKAGRNVQREMRIVKSRSDMVGSMNADAIDDFKAAYAYALKSEKDEKKREALKKQLQPIYDYALLLNKKYGMLADILTDQEEKQVQNSVKDMENIQESEAKISPFLAEYDDTLAVINLYNSNLTHLTMAVKNFDKPGILEHYARVAGSNFTGWANEPDPNAQQQDYKQMLKEEYIRATTFQGAIRIESEANKARYRFSKGFVNAYLKSERISNTSERTEELLGFGHAADPIKIGKELWPDAEDRKNEEHRWRTDILYSTRLNYELFCNLASKFDNPTGKPNAEEKALVDALTGVGATLMPVFKGVSEALQKEAKKEGANREELFTKYVMLSEKIGDLFGHMRHSYQLLYDQIQKDSSFKLGDTTEIIKHQTAALGAMTLDKKGKQINYGKLSVDEMLSLCTEMVFGGEMLVNVAVEGIQKEPVEKNKRGIRLNEEYCMTVVDAELEYDEIEKRVELNQTKLRKDMENHKLEEERIRNKKKLEADLAAELEQQKENERRLQELLVEEARVRYAQGGGTIQIKHLNGVEQGYIPKDAMGKISSFTDYDGHKVEGVGKMKALFDKRKLKGDEIRIRMEKHVKRFLSGKDRVSDTGMVQTAASLYDSCSLRDHMRKDVNLSQTDRIKLGKVEEVLQAKSPEEIQGLMRELAESTMLPILDENAELRYDSAFFADHADSARMFMLHKLLSGITAESMGAKVSAAVKDRVLAIKSNVELMFGALEGGEDYRGALRKQHIAKIRTALSGNGRLIEDIRANLSQYEPKTNLTENNRTSEEELQKFHNMIGGASHVAVEISTQQNEHKELINHTVTKEEIDRRMKDLRADLANHTLQITDRKQDYYALIRKPKSDELSVNATNVFQEDMAKQIPGYEKFSTETKSYIVQQAKLLIPYMMPKELTAFKQFTEADMAYYTAILSERLKHVELSGLVTKETDKDERFTEYYRYAIYEAIRGNKILEENAWTVRKKNLLYYKDAILANSMQTSCDKDFYVKIRGLQQATHGKNAMRWIGRLERIREIDDMIAETCRKGALSIQKPETFYAFCEREKLTENGEIKGEKKGYEEAVEKYSSYIDACFKPAANKKFTKITINGVTLEKGSDVAQFLKDYFSEYGVKSGGEALCSTMETSFNKDTNPDYQKKLAQIQIRYNARLDALKAFYVDHNMDFTDRTEEYLKKDLYSDQDKWLTKFSKLTSYVADGKEDVECEIRTSRRLKELAELNKGQLEILLPILLKNEEFTNQLVGAEEDEYLAFIARKIDRCNDVISNMVSYGYIDQYILEKATEIENYIMSDEKQDVDEKLGLKKLTEEINAQEVLYNKKSITFSQAISSEITKSGKASKKEEKEKRVVAGVEIPMATFSEGALVMEILSIEGAAAVLDAERMESHRKRAKDNTEALLEVLKDETLYQREDETGKAVALNEQERKALVVSLICNERSNVLRTATENYTKGLRERILQDCIIIKDNFVKAHVLADENEELKQFGETIRTFKKKGRAYFSDFIKQSDALFAGVKPDFKEGIFRDLAIDQEHKDLLKEIYMDRGLFMRDSATSVLYTSALKRMIAHAAGGRNSEEKEAKDILVKRDVIALLSLRVFLNATDDYIAKEAVPKGIIQEADVPAFRSGLMELYAEQIMSGSITYTVKDYQEKISALFASAVKKSFGQSENGIGAARYIVDDWAGVASVNDKMAGGEHTEDVKAREDFEKALEEKMDKGSKNAFAELSPEGKVLFEHFLAQDMVGLSMDDVLKSALGQAAGVEDAPDISADALAMKYLQGKLRAEDARINYSALTENLEEKKDIIAKTMALVQELTRIKKMQDIFLEEENEIRKHSVDELHEACKTARQVSETFAKEIKEETTIPNNKKLWRYYTVLRTYALEFEQLEETDADLLTELEREMLEDYKQLQQYVLLLKHQRDWTAETDEKEKNELRGKKQAIEDRFATKLDLYGTTLEDEKKDAIYSGIRGYLYDKDSKKAQGTLAMVDTEEKEYPPRVVAAVKEIDQWVARNATRNMGDTESHFGYEILSHPFRERLFVYYVIEFKRYDSPAPMDATLALNGYVPDVKLFKRKMERSFFNIHNQIASSGIKNQSLIKKFGILDSFGANKTHKLEAAMRTLDNESTDMQGKLKEASERRDLTSRVDVPKPVRAREACFIDLVNQIVKQKALLDSEDKDEEKIDKQAGAVMRALSRLIAADGEVEALYGDVMGERDYKGEADAYIAGDKKQEEGSNLVSTISGYAGSAAGYGIKIADLIKKQPIWKLSDKSNAKLFKSVTTFRTVVGITNLLATIMEVKEGNETADQKPFSERLLARTAQLESASDTFEAMGNLISHLKPAIKDSVENVTGFVSAGTQIVAGSVETAVALTRKHAVRTGEKAAYKYVEGRKEETAGDGQTDSISNEELRRCIQNTSKMQQRTLKAEATQGALKAATGAVSMIGILIPATAPVTEVISTALGVVSKIHAFWANAKQRKQTVDEFIDMDKLYANFMAGFNELSPEVKEHYFPADKKGKRDKDAIKDMLRKETVAAMHFSSLEEYFMDISVKYATMLYREIFFKPDGGQILAKDRELIKERKGLINLFPGLKFGFPSKEGEWPTPSIDDMTENLTRSVG